jgi:hypothetical protein
LVDGKPGFQDGAFAFLKEKNKVEGSNFILNKIINKRREFEILYHT